MYDQRPEHDGVGHGKIHVHKGCSLRTTGEGLESDYEDPESQAEGYEEADRSREGMAPRVQSSTEVNRNK